MGPDAALALARKALRRAPDLVPARALAARVLGRKGEIRKAARLIERAWARTPHPELADIYVDLRPGNSNMDRLARARTLARAAPDAPESRLMVARAALAARNFGLARSTLAPLLAAETRPTARMCLLMAEIEETEFGATGAVREWLARASRAPRDEMWIADGVAAARWAPVAPTGGRLDAFVWQRPIERLGDHVAAQEPEPEPAPPPPMPALAQVVSVAPEPVAIEPVAAPVTLAPPPAEDISPVAEVPPPPVVPAPPEPVRERPRAAAAGPVVFPLAAAPDDPGPEPDRAARQSGPSA
jgi:HemY protein